MRHDNQTNSLVLAAQQELFGWVPFEFWEKVAPGETREKIRTRIRDGKWHLGIHATRPSPKELWIHLRNAKAWIEGRETEIDVPPLPEWKEPEKRFTVRSLPSDQSP